MENRSFECYYKKYMTSAIPQFYTRRIWQNCVSKRSDKINFLVCSRHQSTFFLAFLFGLGTVCKLLNRFLFNMMFQNKTSYLVSLELSCYSNKHYWVWWSSYKTNLSMICNCSLWSYDKHDTNTLSLVSNTTYIDVTDIFFLEIFDKLTIVDMFCLIWA